MIGEISSMTVINMHPVTSPASLQQICTASAASWLIDWSSLVGQVSTRSTPHKTAVKTRGRAVTQDDNQVIGNVAVHTAISEVNFSFDMCYRSNRSDGNTLSNEPVTKKAKHSYNRKKLKKCDRTVNVQYESEISSLRKEYDDTVPMQYTKQHDYLLTNISDSEKSSSKYGHGLREAHQNLDTSEIYNETCFNYVEFPSLGKFDRKTFNENVRNCSVFLQCFLPPTLVKQIINLSWIKTSQLVSLDSHNKCVPDYQVLDWMKRAPALFRLGSLFPSTLFRFDIAGVPLRLLEKILEFIKERFSLDTLNSFAVPKTNFKSTEFHVNSICRDICTDVFLNSSLSTVILNSDICDDHILTILSQRPLKELDVGGSYVTEKGIINGLCALPVENIGEVIDLIQTGQLQCYTQCPLRASLEKLDMTFQNLNSLIFHIIPVIFSELLYYNPHRNIVQCIQYVDALLRSDDTICSTHDSKKQLNLLKAEVGHASRDNLSSIARSCPKIKELSINLDLDAEETLSKLKVFPYLSHLTISYYPSLPSLPPKMHARVLETVLINFRSNLKYLSLQGFNISGEVLHRLSQLPELNHLALLDCWLTSPRILPHNPFSSLETLTMNFLPSDSIMQLFTKSCTIQRLHLDLIVSGWEGNSLTDSYIRRLVKSGMLTTLESFRGTSSFLTLDSLKALSCLPHLKSVGNLATWGLTKEELRCIEHSGPKHIICIR